MNYKTPSHGLKVLSELSAKYPYHQNIKNILINAYVKLGKHDKALDMIDDIPADKTDVQSLKFRAWEAHMYGDIKTEKNIWNKITRKQYIFGIDASSNILIQCSKKQIQVKKTDIVLFTHVYNEMARLPFFLQYYRGLGVNTFFIIDNNSTDNCQDFLLSQSDVHLFWSNEKHSETGSGMVWKKKLTQRYLNKQYCLYVDVDEFLVYPNCENVKLDKFFSYLESNGFDSVNGFMLDMFPDLENLHDEYVSENLIERSPYFYNNYEFMSDISPNYEYVRGGVYHKIQKMLNPMQKVPIIKTNSDTLYIDANHRVTPNKNADLTSVLLHLKMIGDYSIRAEKAVKEKRYFNSGVAYKYYQLAFSQLSISSEIIMSDDKTQRYQNSQQLVDLGLVKTCDQWEKFILDTL